MAGTTQGALAGALTIQTATEQLGLLREALATGAAELDLSAVSECDTAGVQLLVAARRQARARGTALALHNPSEPVREALQRYGIEAMTSTSADSMERS